MNKYTSGAFASTKYGIYKSAQDIIASFPATIIADGQSASAVVKGNMSQSGTPTPANPIYPTETGEKTANLFDKDNTTIYDCYISSQGIWATGAGNKTVRISCAANTQYTLSTASTYSAFRIMETDSENIPSDGSPVYGNLIYYGSGNTYTFTTSNTAKYIIFQAPSGELIQWLAELMLNTGSTPLPYEPYGYKIPILSGGTTTNVYLGEVQSERRIKQIILKGGEVTIVDASVGQALINVPSAERALGVIPISSHYVGKVVTAWGQLSNGDVGLVNNDTTIRICDTTNVTSAPAFNAYLTAQYNNGTPVCIWYVLSTSQTTTLNEPLRKIGTYADSVSVSAIPTTAGSQTFDIDTTLKPSEVDLTYNGWHMYDDKKYTSGAWS